jgi:hypothetical protein
MSSWQDTTSSSSTKAETSQERFITTEFNTYRAPRVAELAGDHAGRVAYTSNHLAAITFSYPPGAPNVKQCPCDPAPAPKPGSGQNEVIRVYHTEPSEYSYNRGSHLIKESRFSSPLQWHAPSDDLVADDVASGSPVAATGYWADVAKEIWETRIYYLDFNGMLRERTNLSYFAPDVKDDFDVEIPKPEELVPPKPGWKLTLTGHSSATTTGAFPEIWPLRDSKLAAVRSEDGQIHLFYQARDNSVCEALFDRRHGWEPSQGVVVDASAVKPGTPLTAVSGGWAEVRLFYVSPEDQLAQSYGDDHINWVEVEAPSYKLSSTAMISAVAWNFASPHFGIRIYTTDDKDELYEFSYSRESGGWAAGPRSMVAPGPRALAAPGGDGPPLSAVAAVIVGGQWRTKVYFHPRRIIAEWDVCSHTAPGIGRRSESAEKKREVEEQTRAKIAEAEERKRQEEERKRKEEEERKRQEEERRRQEAAQAVPRPSPAAAKQLDEYSKIPQGGSIDLSKNPELDQIIKQVTKCSAGYQWKRVADGWQCSGGAHKLTNAQFDALSRRH